MGTKGKIPLKESAFAIIVTIIIVDDYEKHYFHRNMWLVTCRTFSQFLMNL